MPAAALWADAARLVEGDARGRGPRDDRVAERGPTGREDRRARRARAPGARGRPAGRGGRLARSAPGDDRRRRAQRGRGPAGGRLRGGRTAPPGDRVRSSARSANSRAPIELRTMLADFYRGAEAWEPLARVLADGCDHSDDAALMLARASEVAEIYGRLGLLGRAVPVLEKAVGLVPRNEALGLALADGLARCGRHDEARAQLSRLVEQAGWRRTRKRAAPAPAAGRDRARRRATTSSRSPSSSWRRRWTARTRRSSPSWPRWPRRWAICERAERAYRTLLVQTREDATPHPDAPAVLALTEILLRLYGLARKRGHARRGRRAARLGAGRRHQGPEQALRLQRGSAADGRPRRAGAAVREAPRARRRHARRGGDLRRDGREPPRAGQARGGLRRAAARRRSGAGDRAPAQAARRDGARLWADAAARRTPAGARRASPPQGRHGRRQHAAAAGGGRRRTRLRRSGARAGSAPPRRGDAAPFVRGALGDRAARAATGERRRMRPRHRRVQAVRRRGAHAEAAAEALYRAAGLELGRPETRDAGIADLCEAIEKSRDLERAATLVAGAGVPDAELVKILPLYERIARQSGDDAVLLDYLERRVATSDVTHREVREAVDLAVALHRDDRLEPLLVRLLDIAADRADGREDATWALFELLRIKKAAGQLDAAAQILQRATELLPLERVVPLARDLAERAGRSGNRRLGAELLERLRATRAGRRIRLAAAAGPLRDPARPRRPRPPGGGDAAAAAGGRAAERAAHGARAVAADRGRGRRLRRRDPAGHPAGGGVARGGAGAAGRLLRAQRLRGRPRRPAGAGVRHRDRGARSRGGRRRGDSPGRRARTQGRRARGGDVRTRADRRAPSRRAAQAASRAAPDRHGDARTCRADGGGPRRRNRRRGRAPGTRAGGDVDDARRNGCRASRAGEGYAKRRRRPERRRSSDLLRGPDASLSRQAGLGTAREPVRQRGRAPRGRDRGGRALRRSRVAAPGPPGRREGRPRALAPRPHARPAGHHDRGAAVARAGRARRAGGGGRRGPRGARRRARRARAPPAAAPAAGQAGRAPGAITARR